MSNDNNKTTSGSAAENNAPAAENKRKLSLVSKPDNIANKNLVIKDKALYREQLELLKNQHSGYDNKDIPDPHASAGSDSGPDGAASGTVENEEQQNTATIGEDGIEPASETEVETGAGDDTAAEDETENTYTEQQEPETVIDNEYFVDEKDAEQGKSEDIDEDAPELAAETTEEQTTEKNQENDVSCEPEDISEKESESAETKSPDETNTLLSSLINNLKILPVKDRKTDSRKEKNNGEENIPQQEEQSAADSAAETDAPHIEAEPKTGEVAVEIPSPEIPSEEAVAPISQTDAAPVLSAPVVNPGYGAPQQYNVPVGSPGYSAPQQYNVPVGSQGYSAPQQYNVPVRNNLSNDVPYQYNVPVASPPAPYAAKPPVPSRRSEKSFAYTLFIVLLAAMTLVTAFTYLLWSPNGSAGNAAAEPDEPDIEQPAVLEVFRWEENGLLYLSIDGTVLIVVNRDNKLPADYGDGVDPDAKAAYDSMLRAAANEGINIYTSADYLDYESQDLRYNRYANYHGEDVVNMYMQKAGYSENQLGVAFHVNCSEADYMYSETFAQTPEYNWLVQNAAEYGFILRYPEGKESLTGYSFSPWHFRYVGEDLAQLMTQSGMVIEEYLDIAQPLPETV